MLVAEAGSIDGVSYFANDTFGHFVPRRWLDETLSVVSSLHDPKM
ncbi:hypothetical protein ACGFJ7_33950 [Actinoplanes sp. NPDC048988]